MEATLNERVTAATGVDMGRLAFEIEQASVVYLKQRAKVEYYDDLRKVVLAELMESQRHTLKDTEQRITEQKLENLARTQQSYKSFLIDQMKEKEKPAELESNYYFQRNKLEVAQAQLSYLKSEIYLERN